MGLTWTEAYQQLLGSWPSSRNCKALPLRFRCHTVALSQGANGNQGCLNSGLPLGRSTPTPLAQWCSLCSAGLRAKDVRVLSGELCCVYRCPWDPFLQDNHKQRRLGLPAHCPGPAHQPQENVSLNLSHLRAVPDFLCQQCRIASTGVGWCMCVHEAVVMFAHLHAQSIALPCRKHSRGCSNSCSLGMHAH